MQKVKDLQKRNTSRNNKIRRILLEKVQIKRKSHPKRKENQIKQYPVNKRSI